MHRGFYLRRALAVVMTLILSAGIVFVGAQENAYAASKKKLVSKVLCYTKGDNGWEEAGVMEFTYNKQKDPVKIYSNINGQENTDTYSYSYKNGKRAKAKHYIIDEDEGKYLTTTITYDKYGRRKLSIDEDQLMGSDYKYGKNGYISKIEGEDYEETVFHYRWDGKTPKILKTSAFGYKGIYSQSTFNKKGLIEKTSSKHLPGGDRSIKYSFVNGHVKTIKLTVTENNKTEQYKYVLKYTDKRIDRSRYFAMINYIIGGYPIRSGTVWF